MCVCCVFTPRTNGDTWLKGVRGVGPGPAPPGGNAPQSRATPVRSYLDRVKKRLPYRAKNGLQNGIQNKKAPRKAHIY